jgi:magnesium transporter
MYEDLIHRIRQALGERRGVMNTAAVADLMATFHPSDVAAILDELTLPDAERVFAILDDERAAEALAQVAPTTSRHLLRYAPGDRILALLRRLPMDDMAEVVADAGELGQRMLASLPNASAHDVEQLLLYPEHTAGRLMTTKFAVVPSETPVGLTLEYVRAVAQAVETITTIYIVGEDGRLAGACSIRELLIADPHARVEAIMTRELVTVAPETDQQEVAQAISRYDLLALPVVDAGGQVIGIVTVDDVLDVLSEEFDEDYARLIGSDAAEMDRRTPVQVARLRLPWLLGTMAIELCAGAIIARFDAVLREVILLASFMPVISAVSGNVGLQAAAIVVRGLDTGHVSLEHWSSALRRELATALTIAGVAGAAVALVAIAWSRHAPFGLVVGAAMACAVVTAGAMGTVIPMISKRCGFDPATTAGPFETAFQDVIGFTVFLWMATLLARWLV